MPPRFKPSRLDPDSPSLSFNPLQFGLFPALSSNSPRDWERIRANSISASASPRRKPSSASFATLTSRNSDTSASTSKTTSTSSSQLSLDKPLPDVPRGRKGHKKPPITERGREKRRDNSITRLLRLRSNSLPPSTSPTRPPLKVPEPVIKSSAGSYLITERKAVDPANADNRITMPPPTGEFKLARVADDGSIRTASWRATVRYATTCQGFADKQFIQGLLLQLHHLIQDPVLFLELLIERHEEQPPSGLTDKQKRVWEKEMSDARHNVVDILIIWLREFYSAKRDAVIMRRLRDFVMFSCNYSHLLIEKVSSLLQDTRSLNHREMWRKPLIAKFCQDIPPFSANFLRQLDKKPMSALSQLVGNSSGSEVMAQHLTEFVSLVYRACIADPSAALDVLFFGKTREVNEVLGDIQATERAISLFALNSIVEFSSVSKRSQVVAFWTTCAMECIQLNNYSSAGQIYDVLASAAISNLWASIGQLGDEVIQHYKSLQSVFAPGGRYRDLTPVIGDLSRPFFPHLPPMLKVLRAYDSLHERPLPTINFRQPYLGDVVDESIINDVNMLAVRNIANIFACLECAILPYTAHSKMLRNWLAVKLEPLREGSANDHFEILREKAVKTKTMEKKPSKLSPTVTDPWQHQISLSIL